MEVALAWQFKLLLLSTRATWACASNPLEQYGIRFVYIDFTYWRVAT